MSLKVASFNIAHGMGQDNIIDIKRQAELIKKYNPDIICLQEVEVYSKRSNSIDELKQFSKYSRLNFSAMGSNIIFQDGYYGNAIISKEPIIISRNYLFPQANTSYEQRGTIYSKIIIQNKTFHIFSIHLSVYEEERLSAINTLYNIISSIDKNDYIIIAGDFNVGVEKIGNHKYKIMDKNLNSTNYNEYQILQKALNKINNTDLTWFSQTGKSCIDTIFYSQNMELLSFETIKTLYSDHSAIIAEFKI